MPDPNVLVQFQPTAQLPHTMMTHIHTKPKYPYHQPQRQHFLNPNLKQGQIIMAPRSQVVHGPPMVPNQHTLRGNMPQPQQQLKHPGQNGQVPVCYHWQRGYCERGPDCKFAHPTEHLEGQQTVTPKRKDTCRHWQRGHCALGDNCKFAHPTKPCSFFPNCSKSDTECQFRHIRSASERERQRRQEQAGFQQQATLVNGPPRSVSFPPTAKHVHHSPQTMRRMYGQQPPQHVGMYVPPQEPALRLLKAVHSGEPNQLPANNGAPQQSQIETSTQDASRRKAGRGRLPSEDWGVKAQNMPHDSTEFEDVKAKDVKATWALQSVAFSEDPMSPTPTPSKAKTRFSFSGDGGDTGDVGADILQSLNLE
jgi:hypothetical protein